MKKTLNVKRLSAVLIVALIATMIFPLQFAMAKETKADRSVWFEKANGEKVYMDENNTFNLSIADRGTFKNNFGADEWEAKEKLVSGDEIGRHYWINDKGLFRPPVMDPGQKIKTLKNAYDEVLGRKDTRVYFNISVDGSVYDNVKSVKAFVKDKEVTLDKPFVSEGFVKQQITAKFYGENGKEIEVNPDAVMFEKNKNQGGFAHIWNTGLLTTDQVAGHKRTFSVFLKSNPNVRTEFAIKTGEAPIKGFNVSVPKTWAMDKYVAHESRYAGIMDGDNPVRDYQVSYSPANTTQRDLVWKALTPDVAIYEELHSAGIVPIKAGVAKFEVSSKAKPSLKKTVTVKFVYKNPLKSMELESEIIRVDEGERTPLGIERKSTTGEDVTEQRSKWSFSNDSVAKIDEKILDKSSNMDPHYAVTNLISKKEGMTILTGSPLDKTAGAKDVQAVVLVGMDNSHAVIFKDGKKLSEKNVKLVKTGKTVKAQAEPQAKKGKVFAGWYTDTKLTNKWDFKKTVERDMKLYPKWVDAGSVKSTALRSIVKKGKSIKVVLKKIDATGYEVKISTNKNFKSAKTVKGHSIGITVKGLKAKKVYFIKARAYKVIEGKTIYGQYTGKLRIRL